MTQDLFIQTINTVFKQKTVADVFINIHIFDVKFYSFTFVVYTFELRCHWVRLAFCFVDSLTVVDTLLMVERGTDGGEV